MRRGIRNIVELEVKEDIETTLLKIAHQLWPEQGKHLFPHFQATAARFNLVNKGQCEVAIGII